MNDKKLDILIHCKKKEARCKMLEKRDGAAIIKRADGSTFRITVEEHTSKSPFDGIKSFANLPKKEILEITRDSRRRGKR